MLNQFCKILITLAFIWTPVSSAAAGDKLKACDAALTACQNVVKTQDEAIARLKANTHLLEDRLANSTREPLLPTWAVITLSFVAGAAVYGLVHK